jgi:putative acetyltransferase
MLDLRPLTAADYDAAIALWSATEGMAISSADSRPAIVRYLARNPGMSFAAWEGSTLAGAVLCGHDGRRGYLHHLAVAPAFRRQGIATRLVEACLDALQQEGMEKCHLFIFANNHAARAFWNRAGWQERADIGIFSTPIK